MDGVLILKIAVPNDHPVAHRLRQADTAAKRAEIDETVGLRPHHRVVCPGRCVAEPGRDTVVYCPDPADAAANGSEGRESSRGGPGESVDCGIASDIALPHNHAVADCQCRTLAAANRAEIDHAAAGRPREGVNRLTGNAALSDDYTVVH